jgi:transcriptional regulator with XRE-family HTH domain
MSLLRSAIGTVLRRLRHQQGRTLQDVVDAAGVSLPYLSEVERGRKEASSEILASICRALGLPLTDLLEQVRAELLRTSPVTAPVRQPRMGASRGVAGLCRNRQVTRPAQRNSPARRRGRTSVRDRGCILARDSSRPSAQAGGRASTWSGGRTLAEVGVALPRGTAAGV